VNDIHGLNMAPTASLTTDVAPLLIGVRTQFKARDRAPCRS
jgi:hypothetical protein